MTLRHALDPGVRRSADGRLLCGGVPARLTRLSAPGSEALDGILRGAEAGPEAAALARRLRASGTITPCPPVAAPAAALTTVIPVLDGGPALAGLVESQLARGEVIVVDVGSGDGSARLARAAGARVIANARARGPAGARNTGLAAATTDLVAFLDADCEAEPGWGDPLAALLAAEPELALLAPRVRSTPGASRLARYEARHSPLDLGAVAALVGPGRRVAYLPAAALVGRREALLELGGFDESLRYGEDVDLVWRLLAAGQTVRYAPQVEVRHSPRRGVLAFARQRAGYGSSAPALERRHPGAASPLRLGRHTLAVGATGLVLTARGGFALGAAGTLAAAALCCRRVAGNGSDPASRRALARLALGSQAAASVHLARAVSREWLPLTALACLRSRRARRLAGAALLLDTFARERPAPRPALPLSTIALRLVDHGAYASGLWLAAVRARSAAALTPAVGSAGSEAPRPE